MAQRPSLTQLSTFFFSILLFMFILLLNKETLNNNNSEKQILKHSFEGMWEIDWKGKY